MHFWYPQCEIGGTTVNISTAVKNRILSLCQERDISVNRLCTICGITQSTINNIVSGRNNSTTVSTVKKICDGLNITLGEFFSTPEFDTLEQEIY